MKVLNQRIYFAVGFILLILLLHPVVSIHAEEASTYYLTRKANQGIYCGEEVVVISENITEEDYTYSDPLLSEGLIKFDQAKKLILAKGVTKVDTNFIANCFPNLEEIYFSETVKNLDQTVSPWIINPTIIKFEVAKSNSYFTSENGVLYNKEKTILCAYPPSATNTIYTVPNSVKTINENAFSNALKLKKVSFGEKITTNNLGRICLNLRNVTKYSVAVKNPYICVKQGVIFNKTGDSLLVFPLGKGGKYVIPKGTKTIGDFAFYQSKVKNLIILEGVIKLGSAVFGEASIVKISIPSTLTSLEDSLSELYHLQEITVAAKNKNYASYDGILYDKKLTMILHYPLACKNKVLRYPDSVQSIDLTLRNANVNQLVLSKNIKQITGYKDYNLGNVFEKITLSSKNTYFSMYEDSLYNKSKTELIIYAGGEIATFPKELKKLSLYGIYSGKIKEIHISSNVSEIELGYLNGLFDIPTLEKLIVEDGNQKYCFENGLLMNKERTYVYDADRTLKDLNLPEGIQTINTNLVLNNKKIERIVLPSSLIQKESEINWNMDLPNLKEIVVNAGNSMYESKEGVLYTRELKKLLFYPSKKTDETFVMPKNVVDGSVSSLLRNPYVRSITLSDGFKEFNYAQYRSYYSDVKKEYALKEILVGENSQYYTSIQGILYNKDKTELICYPAGADLEEYIVPDTVTELSGLVVNTHMKKLVFGKAVKDISLQWNDDYTQSSLLLPSLQEVVADSANAKYTTVDGILYDKELTTMIFYPGNSMKETITIPKTVKYLFAVSGGRYTPKVPVNAYLKTVIIEEGSRYLKAKGREVYSKFGREEAF